MILEMRTIATKMRNFESEKSNHQILVNLVLMGPTQWKSPMKEGEKRRGV